MFVMPTVVMIAEIITYFWNSLIIIYVLYSVVAEGDR